VVLLQQVSLPLLALLGFGMQAAIVLASPLPALRRLPEPASADPAAGRLAAPGK
jgi:hypothetical protein